MSEPKEPTESELLTRLIEAVEALPEKIGEQVGYKIRTERRLTEDDERSRREVEGNRAYEQRKRAEYEDADRDARTNKLAIVAIIVATIAALASIANVIVALAS